MIFGIETWILDVFGHIGYLLLATGMFLLARKNILGWAFRGAGEAIWLFIGVEMNMSSIWFWGIVFLALEIHGFSSWKRMKNRLYTHGGE
jgi:hypothetical protein